MQSEIKVLWTERLRSGEVEQGYGRLGTPDGKRCCLGVLCDIAVEQEVISPPETGVGVLRYGRRGDHALLPQEVMTWADVLANPKVVDKRSGLFESLAALNDDRIPFIEIANLIEEQL